MTLADIYFFCGIGGNGMSPLARLLAARGKTVLGSDRSFDAGRNTPFFDQLQREGITLVPQDGSAVDQSITTFVVTRAVEDTIPDVIKAKELGLRFLKRPLLMAELFKDTENIAIGGTSGKSTTTGMIGHILQALQKDPTVMNGAIMLNSNSNFVNGKSTLAVFEADESDGHDDVIAVCPASIAVLTNISLDHFELDELNQMFGNYVKNARLGAVLNADCKNSLSLRGLNKKCVTFGHSKDADFSSAKYAITLNIPGEHNQANALAAIAACSLLGIDAKNSIEALKSFKGIKRRLEVVGTAKGVTVIDDFASNPGKIYASSKTVIDSSERAFVVFQPHGFQPTKMMKQGYIETFSTVLRPQDMLLMPDIYYVGGSVNIVNGQAVSLPKDISSRDVTDGVTQSGKTAHHIPLRSDITQFIVKNVRAGDAVIVMGSRDESLSDFAREIYQAIAGA